MSRNGANQRGKRMAQNLRRNCVIEHNIHAPLMDFSNGVAPDLNSTIVLIQQGSIESRVSVKAPGLIHERSSSKVNSLNMVSMRIE